MRQQVRQWEEKKGRVAEEGAQDAGERARVRVCVIEKEPRKSQKEPGRAREKGMRELGREWKKE